MQELHLLPKAARPASAPSAGAARLSSCFTPPAASYPQTPKVKALELQNQNLVEYIKQQGFEPPVRV